MMVESTCHAAPRCHVGGDIFGLVQGLPDSTAIILSTGRIIRVVQNHHHHHHQYKYQYVWICIYIYYDNWIPCKAMRTSENHISIGTIPISSAYLHICWLPSPSTKDINSNEYLYMELYGHGIIMEYHIH